MSLMQKREKHPNENSKIEFPNTPIITKTKTEKIED